MATRSACGLELFGMRNLCMHFRWYQHRDSTGILVSRPSFPEDLIVEWVLRDLRAQMLRTYRKVNRGGLDILMPHHARKAVDVTASFEQERRKRMPELMHRKTDTRTGPHLLHQPPEGRIAQRAVCHA